MYRALPTYVKEHPSFTFSLNDSHKSIIQKITFIRKFLTQILSQ